MPKRNHTLLSWPLPVLVGLIIHLAVLDAAAEMFRWVDKNGVTHFTDTPPDDPETGVKVNPTVTSPDPPLEASAPAAPQPEKTGFRAPPQNTPISKKPAQQKARVELYSASWCGFCKKAKSFFQSKGVPVTEYDIDKDKEAASRLKAIDSSMAIPYALVNGQPIRGYDELVYEAALKR